MVTLLIDQLVKGSKLGRFLPALQREMKLVFCKHPGPAFCRLRHIPTGAGQAKPCHLTGCRQRWMTPSLPEKAAFKALPDSQLPLY